MAAYYNEHDPFAAAWLRELIQAGLIADGEVDARSIELVQPDDLRGFTQCHFFAGIGGWSYALRLAGWRDDRAVWTGSCPCQPFSAAGKGHGSADSRHLWPAWFGLIRECRPAVVFGEQVASADGLGWFDRVSADLEGANYAIGAADLCAASVGAFHIRQRLWFVADAHERHTKHGDLQRGWEHGLRAEDRCAHGQSGNHERAEDRMADASRERRQQERRGASRDENADGLESHGDYVVASHGTNGMGDTECGRRREGAQFLGSEKASTGPEATKWSVEREQARKRCATGELGDTENARLERRDSDLAGESSLAGFVQAGADVWGDADWIPCIDGKARPVEPGTFPLAHGVSGRVGRLRGYGNAIVAPLAAEFIRAYVNARCGDEHHG